MSRIKLGRALRQEVKLLAVLELCRQLYNAALQQRIEAWERQRISLSRYDQQKELAALRAIAPEYKAIPSSMTRATVTTRIDLAFKAFFRRLKTERTPGFPRFRGRDRFDTLIFDREGWKIDGSHLIIKAGPSPIALRMKNAIHRKGEIRGLRLVRRGDRWWAHFLVDIGETPTVKPSTNGVGIDVGLKTFATLSNGEQIEHPRFLKKNSGQLRAVQQSVSRKKRGSNRRATAKAALGRLYEKVTDQRRNFVFQIAAALVKRYDGFAVEKLDVQQMLSSDRKIDGMSKVGSRGLRRGIMDSGWSMFMQQLASKAEEAGMPFVAVDPKGTSQRCSSCGSIVRKTLRDRVHDCQACGLVLNRDVNAAINIFNLGSRLAGAESDDGCTGYARTEVADEVRGGRL